MWCYIGSIGEKHLPKMRFDHKFFPERMSSFLWLIGSMLADGDVKLAESNVVSEYLDTAYPESGLKLFPRDPVKLAKVYLLMA